MFTLIAMFAISFGGFADGPTRYQAWVAQYAPLERRTIDESAWGRLVLDTKCPAYKVGGFENYEKLLKSKIPSKGLGAEGQKLLDNVSRLLKEEIKWIKEGVDEADQVLKWYTLWLNHGFALRLYTRAREEGGPYRDLNCYLNQECINSEHDYVWAGLANVIKCQMYKIKEHILANHSNPHFNTPLVQCCTVYRGIPKSCFDMLGCELNRGRAFVWPTLVSTSLMVEKAKVFAQDEGVICAIRLNDDCVAINVDEISHYGKHFDCEQTDCPSRDEKKHEMEVLLEPYITFKVRDNEERDGYRWVEMEIIDPEDAKGANCVTMDESGLTDDGQCAIM